MSFFFGKLFNPHKHRFEERYGGVYADELGGPRYVHEIWWERECGEVLDMAAKQRAELADRPTTQTGDTTP